MTHFALLKECKARYNTILNSRGLVYGAREAHNLTG